jgi:hypothetical protein
MLTNKVAQSGLLTIDLEDWYDPAERVVFDLKDWLYEGLILREKDYREQLKQHDWTHYRDKLVALTCTADAIVPTWAFMLAATYLEPVAKRLVFGSTQRLDEILYAERIAALDPADFRDQRVIIKGCSKVPVPVSAYSDLTAFLRPLVRSIHYGEPCSTVPVFKRPKESGDTHS